MVRINWVDLAMGGLFSFFFACCCSVQILILEANPIKSGTVDYALLSDNLSFRLGREPHQSRLEKTVFDIFDNPTNIHHRQVELRIYQRFFIACSFPTPKISWMQSIDSCQSQTVLPSNLPILTFLTQKNGKKPSSNNLEIEKFWQHCYLLPYLTSPKLFTIIWKMGYKFGLL